MVPEEIVYSLYKEFMRIREQEWEKKMIGTFVRPFTVGSLNPSLETTGVADIDQNAFTDFESPWTDCSAGWVQMGAQGTPLHCIIPKM